MNQKEMKLAPCAAPSSGATCRAKGQYQREFRKQFDTACSRHNRWQVWSDFVIIKMSGKTPAFNPGMKANTLFSRLMY